MLLRASRCFPADGRRFPAETERVSVFFLSDTLCIPRPMAWGLSPVILFYEARLLGSFEKLHNDWFLRGFMKQGVSGTPVRSTESPSTR